MRKGDKELTPHIAFTGTKATIEAWASPVEGMEAITTDTHEQGFYDGSAWVWGGGGGGYTPPATTAANDFQVGDGTDWQKKTLAETKAILGVSNSVVQLADVVLGSAVASIDLTSISGSYKHLRVMYSIRSAYGSAGADVLKLIVNNDTSAIYNYTQFYYYYNAGYGTGTGAGNDTKAYLSYVTAGLALANSFGGGSIEFYDYAASKFKYIQTRAGIVQSTAAAPEIYDGSALYRSTTAISRLTFSLSSGANLATGSRITLYGLN